MDILKEAMQKHANEQELAIKRAISNLPSYLQDSEEVNTMFRSFAIVLGWQTSYGSTHELHQDFCKAQE